MSQVGENILAKIFIGLLFLCSLFYHGEVVILDRYFLSLQIGSFLDNSPHPVVITSIYHEVKVTRAANTSTDTS